MSFKFGLELRFAAAQSVCGHRQKRARDGENEPSPSPRARHLDNSAAATMMTTIRMPQQLEATRPRPHDRRRDTTDKHKRLKRYSHHEMATDVMNTRTSTISFLSSTNPYHHHYHHRHHHHNHHRHQHHQQPHFHWPRWRHSRRNSIEPSLSRHNGALVSFSPMMFALSPKTRSMIFRAFLVLTIIFTLSPHSRGSGLDSPVKVQRNKQLQQHQQGPTNATLAFSSESPVLMHEGTTSAPHGPKIDRVRRTNSIGMQPTRMNQQQQASQQQRDCPSNRLIQGLLPPEYAGSPATSQRPSMARAHCECLSDPLGWHLTCFAGSSGAGVSLGSSRGPGGSTVAPMPDQLHPAFRSSQMARQQQQASSRRQKRSSSAEGDQAPVSHEASDEASPHEGFGEDFNSVGGQHQQQPSISKPAPQKQRDQARPQQRQQQQQQQQQRHQQNRQEAANYITSFSRDQDSHQQESAGQSVGASQLRAGGWYGADQEHRQQQQPTRDAAGQDRLVSAASNLHSQHLTFQPVPVLFGIKYLRNNMIEIDCDQSVPNYKAAMFRGFNVNEINSFTFNNCQLPNIPFSVLLHRTRTAPDSVTHFQAEAAPAIPTGGFQQGRQPQALKPNRRQQFGGDHSLHRRRRWPIGDDDQEGDAEARETGAFQRQRPASQGERSAATTNGQNTNEPKVKSLTINLNAIVDQRTLITLLTGLDLLEELQLNYMQLNLTSFINDLQQMPPTTTTAAMTSASSTTASTPSTTTSTTMTTTNTSTANGASANPASPSSLGANGLTLAASANVDSASSARVATAKQMASLSQSSPTSASSQLTSQKFVSPTMTSTTSSTTSTTTTTTTTPSPTTTTTTNPNNIRPLKRQPTTVSATTFATGVGEGSLAASSTAANHQRTTGQSYAPSTATGPSIGLGAPRGLMIAQATGIPSTVTSTTPLTNSNSYQTTDSVPSVNLSTVLSSVSSSSSTSEQQQPQQSTTTTGRSSPQQPQSTTTSGSTNSVGQGQRNPQNGSNLISVGLGQSHSVSYTALGPTTTSNSQSQARTTRPQSGGMYHLAPATTTTISSTSTSSGNQTPTSSTLMSSGSSAAQTTSSAGSQQSNPNRLQHSPSAWTVGSSRTGQPALAAAATTTGSQPAAGSRLSVSSGQPASTSDLLISATSSAPPSTPASSQQLSWSAIGAVSPATAALTTPASSSGLSAPVNTPSFTGPTTTSSSSSSATNLGSSYGFRTGGSFSPGSPVPTAATTNIQNTLRTMTTMQLQGRRQPTTTTSSSSSQDQQGGFVAAGIRLHQQQAAGGLGNQRRFHHQQHQQPNSGPPATTTTSRFPSSFSSSSGASPAAVSDDQFVSHQDDADHDHRARRPTLIAMFSSGDRRHNNEIDNNNRHNEEDASSSGSNDDDDDDDSLESSTSTTPNLERISRATRSKRAASASMEEFELSFGDLLPNLRTLKLESFIDLSPLMATGSAAAPSSSARQEQTRKRTGQSGVSVMRFKRQLEPEGEALPERESRAETGEPLVAEESKLEVSSMSLNLQDSFDNDDRQPDVEPGETLWRSASSHRSSSLLAGDDDDSDAPHVSVAAPASMANANSVQHDGKPQADSELTWAESQLHQRQRQFSTFILGRLFSRLNKLQVLHLTSNEIPYWPDNVLYDSRHSLVRLYLISSNIRQLGARSFANLVTLRSLDLSSNQLRHLDADLFRDLVELRQVRACRNLFRRLPLKLLMKQQHSLVAGSGEHNGTVPTALVKLESVDFSKNKYLTEFQLDQHQATTNQLQPFQLAPVTSLNLSDCSFGDQLLTTSGWPQNNSRNSSSASQMLFAALTELTSVSLKNNRFRELLNTANLFGKNRQLRSIDLSHNQLERLNSHLFNANASQIQDLRLNHNKLSELPEQLLFNLRKLRHLSLAHNRLVRLNSKMFITNQLLETLDLSHNQLTTLNTYSSGQIPFGNGANLKQLSLAHNNLSAFEQDVFDVAWSFYTQLHSLDLSHNKFSGQIQMPIFYTITDEMLLNLGSNRIQSVSVEALVQHEQVLDRYATSFETLGGGSNGDDPEAEASGGARPTTRARGHDQSAGSGQGANYRGPPTVTIRLANNPLACDCMLEPLISYTRRVAAATNPALVASLFQHHQQQPGGGRGSLAEHGLPSGSKYSFGAQHRQDQPPARQQQPQVLYQFKFNELHCDKPKSLHRRLLSHISIGDLLCPVQDERLCPRECECHYQSAFKTVIVDCNGRHLRRVPEQLSDASNFNQFEVLTSFNLSAPLHQHLGGGDGNRLTISHVDKMIIRLDNNQLVSIDELARLFQVVSLQQPGDGGDQQQPPPHPPGTNVRVARALSSVANDQEHHQTSALMDNSSPAGSNKKISPVAMARLHQLQLQQQRQTREAGVSAAPLVVSATEETPIAAGMNSNNYLEGSGGDSNEHYSAASDATSSSFLGADFDSTHRDTGGATAPALPPISTAVLESAEEFRNKRYSQKTCELYLDHNNIDSLPDSFMAALDQVRLSSLQASLTPPQAALPTAMLEPPIHTKLNNLNMAADSPMLATDPMKMSGSSLHNSISAEEPPVSSLFGQQPFAAEKKAALMESVQQSVRLNKLQQQQQDQQNNDNNKHLKFTVSPSLVVLSLRYNNLANLNAKTLNRLSKLIKSSGTRLYFGHNPFNCSDNFSMENDDNLTSSSSVDHHHQHQQRQQPSLLENGVEDGAVASPMGDQLLAASDSVSGAYLEPSPDDLTPLASGENSATISSTNSIESLAKTPIDGPLTPADCPVGQLKSWLTRHHSHVGDLDELYCVHMPNELADKLKLLGLASSSNGSSSGQSDSDSMMDHRTGETRQKARRQVLSTVSNSEARREHDHPWTSSLNSPALSALGTGDQLDQTTIRFVNTSHLHKNGVVWNADLLMVSAKLIDLDLYDLCPYSNIQLLDSVSLGYLSVAHQRILISVAAVFILISLCLLLMLIYFGDTQTILAFVYIHMNPIYNCLHLNESHLDGEKLYDAFVSYSSADRDIVMELIEHLEQPGVQFDGQRLLADGKGTTLDKSRDVLVTEDDLRPDLLPTRDTNQQQQQQALGTLQRRSTSTLSNSAASFQDLSTMSRSTSRMMLDAGDYSTAASSRLDISSSPALRSEPNNNSGLHLASPSSNKMASVMSQQQQMHQLNANRPYRLCIHERDWLPGHLISWNIVNSVQNSRRTILILSKEFIKSVWFQVEFHTAYYQMLEDKIDRLIVIVRGELPPKHELDKNLAFLLTTKTYLTWGEKWFWERLHYALPHRAGPPPPLAVSGASKPKQRQPRLKKQQAPVSPSNRDQPLGGAQSTKLSGSAAGLLSSLAAGHADPPKEQQQQQHLIMSNIGKDCSKLLLTNSSPTASNRNNSSSSSAASSGSSGSSNTLAAGQAGGARSASASSFLSGSSSTNQLFKHESDHQIMTTSNDLLSSPISPRPSGGGSNTTRLNIGGNLGMRSSSPLQPAAGGDLVSAQPRASTTTTSGGITSIMLDGGSTGGATGGLQGPNSRARSKRQEKLQSFVESEISSRFNLSEL